MEMQSHPLRKQARTAVRGIGDASPPPLRPPTVAIVPVGGAAAAGESIPAIDSDTSLAEPKAPSLTMSAKQSRPNSLST
jgi:hypothetical protein